MYATTQAARRTDSLARVAFSLFTTALLASCSGSSGNAIIDPPGGEFIVLRTTPANNGIVFLNDSLAIDLSMPVDPTSADFNAMSFAAFDLKGTQLVEPMAGTFHVTTAPGDESPGRRLEFVPKFPSSDTFDDGGFKPGRRYVVNLVKGDHRVGVGLMNTRGKGLEIAHSFQFQTVDGTTPSQLFRDTRVGGPRRVDFDVAPLNRRGEAELNELGQIATELRLTFDQPLNPHSKNLPVKIDLDPRRRKVAERGRIYLEYDDPVHGDDTWIPAAIDLETNSLKGAVVVVRPFGILPNNAEIRVIVAASLEDLSGENNAGEPNFDRVFGAFRTASSYELRFDAVVETFANGRNIDFEAPHVEPLAEVVPGAIRASFDFAGGSRHLDYEPNSQDVVLDTDFTQITPKNGQPINVSGGRFEFRNVRIPREVTVRGVGSNPMVWLVTGDFIVEGELLIEGGNGQRVNALNSANSPAAGGIGHCTGGNGGQGSWQTSQRSLRGESGYGARQAPNGGGRGGRINCTGAAVCGIGSGGGGGTFATLGDPYYKVKANQFFVQPRGVGGFGCSSRSTNQLPGGNPGPLVFTDPRRDNDFWGAAVDVFRRVRITGEISVARGGQGGGGGGDYSLSCLVNDPNFANDDKGGGGGAGGGVLIIKALGDIKVTKSGRISANGGDGGGGAWAGSNNRGGGGGGGAGGMVILMAGRTIDLEVHGETYANNDYDFSISADGGVGLRDPYNPGIAIRAKYNPEPHATSAAALNQSPTGGFGGLGIVQLMAPAGPDPSFDDGTNTILDDHIIIRDGENVLTGAAKQRYLGWRGMPDENGVGRDDKGVAVDLGDNVGDIRPAPLLLPAPFGNTSRVRSKWIDLGAANRRTVAAGGDGQARGVERQGSAPLGSTFGPAPEFAGVVAGKASERLTGYITVDDDGRGGVRILYPTIVSGLQVASIEHDVRFRGQSTLAVTVAAIDPTLDAAHHRYAHYTAALVRGSSRLSEFRIVGHTGSVLYLVDDGLSPAAVPTNPGGHELEVVAKFFEVFTRGEEGFPQTFAGRPNNGRLPVANVRLRFAFHQDPSDPNALRFPADPNEYFADWGDSAVLEELRKGGYRFVRYDVLFDTRYEEDPALPNPTSLSPDTALPELRKLVLPYRY